MFKIFLKILCVFFISAGFISCIYYDNYAPVTDIHTTEPIPKNGKHKVDYGETLYSIAWMYGLDYKEIAQFNHIAPPYVIHEGKTILLPQHQPTLATLPKNETPVDAQKPQISRKKPVLETPPRMSSQPLNFVYPANGPLLSKFGPANKGINIGGNLGAPIYATSAGKIVYSGNGLRGYGNLIIIKHNSTFLSAYAHNQKILVREGDVVQTGQKIAEMGNSGTSRTMLHFEIRRNGQPVNPIMYLTQKN